MKQIDLLKHANAAYDDGFLEEYFDKEGRFKKSGRGDGLAAFIVIELLDTFDTSATDKQQFLDAAHALSNAKFQLEEVQRHLEELGFEL